MNDHKTKTAYVPYEWTAVFQQAGLHPSEKLAAIYALVRAYREGDMWLAIWPVDYIAEKAAIGREAVMSARRKLNAAGFVELAMAGNRAAQQADTLDVTRIMEHGNE